MELRRMPDISVLGAVVAISLFINFSSAENSTQPSNTTAVHGGPVTFNIAETIPQIVLTMIVVAFALIIGICIGKFAEFLYDRHMANRDDISDISEHTREILKANVARLKRKGKTDSPDSGAAENVEDMPENKKVTLLSMWSQNKAKRSSVAPSPRKEEPETDGNDNESGAKSKNPEIQVTGSDECGTTVEVINEQKVGGSKENLKTEGAARVVEDGGDGKADAGAKRDAEKVASDDAKLMDVESVDGEEKSDAGAASGDAKDSEPNKAAAATTESAQVAPEKIDSKPTESPKSAETTTL